MKKNLLLIVILFAGALTLSAFDGKIDIKKGTIEVDGEIDALWNEANGAAMESVKIDDGDGDNDMVIAPEDCSGSFKLLWDDDYLYIMMDVKDDVKVNDSPANKMEHDDGFDIPFDLLNTKLEMGLNSAADDAEKAGNVMLYGNYSESGDVEIAEEAKWSFLLLDVSGVIAKCTDTDEGYIYEIAVPLGALEDAGLDASAGTEFGFDCRLNDDDNIVEIDEGGGKRTGHIGWSTDNGWNNPSTYGTVVLTDDVAVSVKDKLNPTFRVYPNPAVSTINVANVSQGSAIRVINSVGQVVKSVNSTGSMTSIDTDGLKKGLYIVKAQGSSRMITLK